RTRRRPGGPGPPAAPAGRRASRGRTRRSPPAGARAGQALAISSCARLLPDAAVVHEAALAPDQLLLVLCGLHWGGRQAEVLWIDGPFVQELVQLGPHVLQPVVPLGRGPVVTQRLDVHGAGDVGGAAAVVLAPDDPALVVDDERAAAEGVDRRR